MDLYIAKILSYVCFQMDFAEIDRLLGAAWLGAALICVAAALPIKALHPLRSLVLACCRRGKLLYSSSSSSKRFTVPQSFFTHFYVVGVTWNTLLLATATLSSCMCTLSSATDGIQFSALVEQFTGAGASAGSGSIPSMAKQKQRGWTVVLLLLLMELQVCRRLYESLMVLSYGPDARMHLLGYLVGLFFYVAAPLSLCCQEIGEIMINTLGTVSQGRLRSSCAWNPDTRWWECFHYSPWRLNWYQWLGALLFLWGWYHQYKCHQILASLSSEEESGEGKTYVIPYGDWFDKVSCAHYLSEIVMYFGLVFASGGTQATIWFLLAWVFSNLYLAAKETHEWYLSKFENYPKNRKALIPFLY
ncbi:polyprenol reductase 2 isoform X1 [Selaginella moellendorffii]|uniref:polyprenol reductase 2 isoform X1 n=1 Tax=Selaginella moellendorffii TaxID=88036 RepID=UPI000D1D0448|nr:polyprenol reductase 2 isoform X1 [Selaginella moellendorffii]|eukprot:XP_024528091.1 polyprenol reductase 2 isoform X1 [Selaginella moellendorffii]